MPANKPVSTRIVLSGVEGDRHWNTAINQGRSTSLLMSFLYVEKKGTAWLMNRLKSHPNVRLIIDSGAHSFRTTGYDEKWPDLAWFDDYAERYKEWILQVRDVVDFVVNLDVDTPCGMENMLRWDNEVFRPLERAGVPVCYVWHEKYGFDGWLKMCREHSFVGLPGNLEIPVYHRMMKAAIHNGCRVHGFAATKAGILGKVPFSSADSISWKSGEMYGQTFVFENGSLKVYDKTQKDVRAKYKSRWVSLGVDWDALERDEASEITKVCAIAWADYQDHVEVMTKKLAYWNKTSILVDDFLLQHGGYGAVTKEQVQEFLVTHKCNHSVTSEQQARDDIRDIQAFLSRDDSIVFGLPDDRLDYWIHSLKAEPENTARAEREAAVRQKLYESFYKLQAEEALARTTMELVTPIVDRTPSDRDEAPPEAPSVLVQIPLAPGHDMVGPPDEAPESGEESTPPLITMQDVQALLETTQPAEPAPQEPPQAERKSGPDRAFVDGVEDSLLRSRVSYGVELVFHQNKLKHEAQRLRVLRREPKKQKALLQKAAALGVEISTISEEAGPTLAGKMIASGEQAFSDWKEAASPDADKAQEKKLVEKATALNPQARKLVADPELASRMGRLGGAPKGNQNARKHGLYSARLPQMACDSCPHIQVCPQYRAGHVCAFLTEFSQEQQSIKESAKPFVATLENLLQTQVARLRRSLLFETFEGGIINKETSKVAKSVQDLAKLLNDLSNPPVQAARLGFPQPAAAGEPAKRSSLMDLFMNPKTGVHEATVDSPKQDAPKPENPQVQ